MPKLSFSLQTRPPPSGSSSEIHDLRACSTASSYRGAKRKTASSQVQARGSSRRAKRPKILLYCSSQTLPVWGAKLARTTVDSSLPFQHNKWRDWAGLGEGPAGLIAELLLANDVADYVSFRAACRPWRLCAADPRKLGILDRRFHPHQWIILRESGGTPYRCGFMNISTGNCRYLDLPDLRGHDVFPTSEGLLVLRDRTTCVLRLLNPFTCQVAELPAATTLLTGRELALSYRRRNMLEVTGAGLVDESTIGVHFGRIKTVAVVKPGDGQWTVVDHGTCIGPAMSFAGRFYCARDSDVTVVETSADHTPQLALAAKLIMPMSKMMMDTVHLVNHEGELILVIRKRISNDSREFVNGNGSRTYNLFRVALDSRKIVPIHSLGGSAVFIGMKLALSVSPSVFPSISTDAIYLSFDQQLTGSLDNSPIHLLEGTSEPREFDSCSYGPPTVDDYLSWFVTGLQDD